MGKLNQIDIRSEEVQEILSSTPNWIIQWGNIVLFSLLLLLFFISWFIKYPDIILSEAIITTQIPPEKEYAKTRGKLEAVLVKDNDFVKSQQPLAIIENTANYEDVFKLQSIIDTVKINNQSFRFPIDKLSIHFLGDIESQYDLFENSYIQYQLNKELQPFSNEALANKYSISELNRRLHSQQSQKEINMKELKFKQKELERNRLLFHKGVISAQDYENKELEFAQAQRNYKDFESSISQIREGISNAHRTSKGTEIDRVKEEMALLRNVIQSYNQLKKAIKDWEYQYVLKSNINGKVSFLNYWTTNQTVNQGDLVFTIIPNENSSFIAKLKSPAQNSGKIKVNQDVNIKLENYPSAEFGVLKGKVKNISLIPDMEGLYLIDVELPQNLITSYNRKIEFKQEMRGTAEIITENLRLIERFFYQFREILKQ
ncbi:HlyD family secretion protein [Yeosuana sp.]|uniref:HlyD family secretion protein n=1 Tax=Yeosuana sp. TaxID=2529388 RepID=UPI004054E7F5